MTAERSSMADGGGRGRSWSWLLVISLALNLLIVGAAVGGFIMHSRGPEPVFSGAALSPGELMGFLRTIPAERRRAIRQVLSNERQRLQGLRSGVAAARETLGEAMVAEKLDTAALTVATNQLYVAEGNLRRAQLDAAMAIAAIMTRDERQKFVEWRRSRWKGPGGPGHADADGPSEATQDQGASAPQVPSQPDRPR